MTKNNVEGVLYFIINFPICVTFFLYFFENQLPRPLDRNSCQNIIYQGFSLGIFKKCQIFINI